MRPAPDYVNPGKSLIWGNLLHLSRNFWADRPNAFNGDETCIAKPVMDFQTDVWNELTQKMSDVGMNMVVIDLGDAVKYDSHPEISLPDAWSKDRLGEELSRLRGLGLEPIPKLNFSATHDIWLGPYSRCVSSKIWYEVCADLIAEVIHLFDTPRLFHLGMDEETYNHQGDYEYVVVRQYDLWWKDALFLIEQVDKGGSQPWVWSDYVWNHSEEFWRRMPLGVMQSNWYYGDFENQPEWFESFDSLDRHGYPQIPTGSNWECPDNFTKLVAYCREHISKEQLHGFLQTAWKPTRRQFLDVHNHAIDLAAKAIQEW